MSRSLRTAGGSKPIPASSGRTPLPPSGDIEIGWHLHPDAWGHGYAAEAAARVLAHAFACGLDKVVAVTNIANTASQTVAKRNGMSHLGRPPATTTQPASSTP